MMKLTPETLREWSLANRDAPLMRKRIIIGLCNGHVVTNDLSQSYIIGGMPAQGKSTIAAWLACQMVVTGGKLVLIDPHRNEPNDSLYGRIAPLAPWFALPVTDFDEDEVRDVLTIFKWLKGDLSNRLTR